MKKLIILVVVAACGGTPKSTRTTTPTTTTVTAAPETVPEPKPATFKPGPNGLPLPLDADDGEPAPAGITIFKVPRGKAAVADELRVILKEVGWEILSEGTSPRGAIRIEVHKAGETPAMLRLTGDDTQTALIVEPRL
jgi:hypothetical protein